MVMPPRVIQPFDPETKAKFQGIRRVLRGLGLMKLEDTEDVGLTNFKTKVASAPQEVITGLRKMGRTPETETFLKSVKPNIDEDGLSQLFGFSGNVTIPNLPVDEQVRQGLKGFEVKRGNISSTSATVTGTAPIEGLRLPQDIQAESLARQKKIREFLLGDETKPLAERIGLTESPETAIARAKQVTTDIGLPVYDAQGNRIQYRPATGAERATALARFVVTGALPTGAYGGIASLKPVVEGVADDTLKAVLSTGIDQWITRMSRGIPPEKLPGLQNKIYNLLVKNKTWLQERATNNWLARKGKTPNTAQAVQNAVADTLRDVEDALIPRGTQTGAMAFGGKAAPGNGDEIAKALGVQFQGIQRAEGVPDTLTFKDPVTNGNISGNTLEEVQKELQRVRATLPHINPEGAIPEKELTQAEIDNMRAKFESAKTPQRTPTLKLPEDVIKAVKGTPGAEIRPDGLKLVISRYQTPEQAGKPSVRGGVFYMPEAKSKYQRYYTTGRIGYGGKQRIQGEVTITNPIVAKGASGGKVPERVYDTIRGKGSYEKMRTDVLANALGSPWEKTTQSEHIEKIRAILEKYGGHSELAGDILKYSNKGNQLAYAIQENIVAATVEKAGYDAILGYSVIKDEYRLSEVMLVKSRNYPDLQTFIGKPSEANQIVTPAPLHAALIQEGEQLIQQAEQMAPSTSVQTGLPGMGKETAQIQMFGEVSGKESRKAPLVEVTKPKKGAEPLPGQMEAFREAETQGQEIADKAAIEAQARREVLGADPVASYRFKIGGKNVGLDSLISIKEQSFPETLTVKQAQALNPEKSFAKYTVKGTKFYNKVPKDAALDQLTKEFNMTPDEIADRVMEIRAEKRAIRQSPLTPAPEPTQEEKAVATTFGEAKVFNEKQKAQLVRMIGEYLENPNTDSAWELTRELRRETRAGQAVRLNERTQELLAEGVATEAAMTQAKREIMTGELPKLTTDYFDDLTDTMRAVLFDRMYQILKDEPFEMLSTQDALTNALAGRPIPREPGVKGGSALTRLQRVFGNQPKLLAGIEKMAEEKKPLRDVVEGAFRESGQAPIPIDQDIADYLRALPETQSQATLGAVIPGEGAVKFVYDPSGKLGLELQGQQIQMGETSKTAYKTHLETAPNNDTRLVFDLDMVNNEIPDDVRDTVLKVFDKEGLDAAFDRLGVEMAQGPREPTRPDFIDKNVWDTFKEKGMPGFNFGEKKMIVKVLQEILMSPIDIGNWLRANMSSVDLSGIRTGRMLGSGHPVAFYKSVLSGWKATWSQKEADAHWRAITLDPDYELYERIRKDFGYDPLRVPAKEGEAAFRKSEEFGFPIEERFIPRMGQKLPHIKMSGRGFETLLNDLVWSVWKQKLAMARRYAMKVASGKIKMKPGEAWDITKEMTDHQRMLGDVVQRASLNINVGKVKADFTPASPALGGALFAPRAKWARLIVGRHLFSANPRVRAEAWKDMSIWVASTAGVVLLGAMLGLWEVETDPVSGQFMSIRIGKTRIDLWEGHRQIVNLYSRLITGQTKSSITGKKTETDVMATLSNFVRSSLNVLPGLITDIKMGRTFTGEKTDITNIEQTAQRVLPFSLGQIWEVFQENWRLGLATLPLSVAGESLSAYDTAESLSAAGLAKLGKVDIEGREEKVQEAKEAGFTSEKIAEIMTSDKAYDIVSLRTDLNKSTSKGAKSSPIVADYWTFKEQDDKYSKMSTEEQETYLKDNPAYVTDRIFWGETSEIPDVKTANELVARAGKYGFDLNTIPAFQKADKTFKIGGKEVKRQVDRIPTDRELWPAYFDYKNLPEDTTQTVRNAYLNDNPDIEAFLVVNTDRTSISSLEAANKAADSGVPLDQIPAFSLTDKGKERIPTDRNLWKSFFDYNDLPGTSYLNFTREQVDAGLLPEKYLKEWETYHKLKTDTAKDIFRKAHKEVAKGDWRDDFRRANPDFDKWLQENQDMKPLPPKKTAAISRGISPVRVASPGRAGLSVSPRAGKKTYPKFKKLRVKTGMSVGAPRAPGV